MKRIITQSIALFAISAMLYNCGGTTYMVDSWKDPDASIKEGDLQKVMVAVLGPNETARRSAEDQVTGYNAVFVPSYQVLNTQKVALDTIASKSILQKQNFDAVLTMRLKEKNKTQTWVPGSTNMGYGYWGYHGMYYGAYYDPGYMRDDVSYVVETTLFSLKDNELLWSGITSSVNPTSANEAINQVVKEVYYRMQKDDLFDDDNE